MIFLRWAYNQGMSEISAGAITYTIENDTILYLLIKDFHGNYGFPKGHLENKETKREAALREIKEEAGIDVTLDETFEKELVYIMPNGIEKTSVYYLGYYENQTPVAQEEEVETMLLLPYEEAYEKLTFDNMKEVLAQANDHLKGKYE